MSEVTIEVFANPHKRKRNDNWCCRVVQDGEALFLSDWVALRLETVQAATWLAELVKRSIEHEFFLPAPGHRSADESPYHWKGDMRDDCYTNFEGLNAHAEWVDGPYQGGNWYCQVMSKQKSHFHTADMRMTPGSGSAARWTCEMVISAAVANVLPLFEWQD